MSQKTNNPKQQYAKRRLRVKQEVCTTIEMVKWCKNFLARTTRRKSKQELNKEMNTYEYQSDVID